NSSHGSVVADALSAKPPMCAASPSTNPIPRLWSTMRSPETDRRNCVRCSLIQASSSSRKECGAPSAPPSLVMVDPPHRQCSLMASRGGHRPNASGHFAPVGQQGERSGDEEEAAAPGEGDPDRAAHRLLLKHGSERVDDRG